MARPIQVTFDTADPHAQASWWADLLGYEVEDHHDRIAGMLEAGIVTDDQVMRVDGRLHFADLVGASDPDGAGPRLLFQRVPEEKVAKNRVHLDVRIGDADLDEEAERVAASGATFVEFQTQGPQRWAVMADPEGNEFCLT